MILYLADIALFFAAVVGIVAGLLFLAILLARFDEWNVNRRRRAQHYRNRQKCACGCGRQVARGWDGHHGR